jgi:hypothetical protein
MNAAVHLAIAGKLTSVVGKALAGFPVEPWMGKVLLAGAELGCAREALIVVAMAATDPVWLTPRLLLLLCLLLCPFTCPFFALSLALSLPFPLPFLCPFPCPFFAVPLALPLGIAPSLALALALAVRHSASWVTCMTCDLACFVMPCQCLTRHSVTTY